MISDYRRVGVVQTPEKTIWKGFDPSSQREVALKQLRGASAADAVRRAATVLAGLRHPNIVSVYDVLDDDGTWLVEQWISGAALSAVLAQTGKLRAVDALALVHGALSGLAYAHDRDVVHGDVTPGNVLIDASGTPMLVDFGLAVAPGRTTLSGTPGYMAPEAAAGGVVTKRSDVYSSCLVLAEMLTGTKRLTGTAQALHGIEAPVASVLTMGLDPRPELRPVDAAALLTLLDEAAERTHGKGWLAAAGLGAIGSTATIIGAGVTLTGSAAAASGVIAGTSTSGAAAGQGVVAATSASGAAAGQGVVAATSASGAAAGQGVIGATSASGTAAGQGALAATPASGTAAGQGALAATSASGTAAGQGVIGATSASGTAATAAGKGKLIAGAAVATGVIAGVGALFAFQPDTPQQSVASSATTTTTTTTTPPPVALPPPPPAGPTFQGTYSVTAVSNGASRSSVLTLASDCPRCDATGTWDGKPYTFTWTGVGWENTEDTGGCGPRTVLFTPTGDVDGVVQNFTMAWNYANPAACGVTGLGGTAVRTG